jgi:outer membrane protein TolC
VPIETAGKRRYRMAHAEHLSEVGRLNITTAAWQVRSAVRVALLDYAMARRRAELLREQVGLRERATELLEQRLAAGAIGMPEVSQARIALLRLRADSADAERVATEARVKIAEAIGLPAKAIEGVEFTFDLRAEDAELVSANARRQALLGRADILALLAEYAASQSALQLEIAKQYPDVHFNPGYQYDQGENKWSLGLSVELPVLYRNQGGIREAAAKRDEVAARFLALQAQVISQIDRAMAARASATQQLRQLEELTRAQREIVAQTEASFKAGAADQFEVASAHLEFATSELARLDALVKQQQAIGLLEDALQKPFDAMNAVERDPKLHAQK